MSRELYVQSMYVRWLVVQTLRAQGSRLVDCVSFPVEFLFPYGSPILPLILPEEYQNSIYCLTVGVSICLSQLKVDSLIVQQSPLWHHKSVSFIMLEIGNCPLDGVQMGPVLEYLVGWSITS